MSEWFVHSSAAAVVAVALGVLASVIAGRTAKQRKLEKEMLENVLTASKTNAVLVRSGIMKLLSATAVEGGGGDVVPAKPAAQLVGELEPVVQTLVESEKQLVEKLVNHYHEQALFQASVQFWFSVIAATVGFLYILYAGSDFQADNWATLLKKLPGIVIDAVAVLFFQQAEKTRQRATELYDRLRLDSNTLAAKDLLTEIKEEKIRSIAQAQIALHLAGVVTKDFDISLLIKPA